MKLDNRLKSRLQEKKIKQRRERRRNNLIRFALFAALTVLFWLARPELIF
ncbi:MAG: hypothetical protein II948_00460 [Synergistaceae bacterium]|nr:hypothetical protein [Synergistaceae bacterium]MBQ4419312.1 hypothetical protein [Synergistaceae bacterium]MBQ6740579.1 hypothetical protein [Synergistaceae bacterium]MBQ7570570.1 hypothetical protein [Synergistaceae bacterium]MBQ9582269.1 hypothetical protein [Synergistaceae bacterium]